MSCLGILPSRMRAALIVVLAAFAAIALASPGAASAAGEELSLECTPAILDAGETSNCVAVVSAPWGPPTGEVRFFFTGFSEYIRTGDKLCELKIISPTASSCSMPLIGHVESEENVIAHYPALPQPEGEGAAADNSEVVIHNGSMRVYCEDPVIVRTEQTECRAYIPTEPGASPATGTVEFSAANRYHFMGSPDVEPECELEPFAEGASCSVTLYSQFDGEFGVLGRYEGDGTYPAESGTGFMEAILSHQTSVETSCDRQQPLLSTLIECTVTVTSISPRTGPPPVGLANIQNLGTGSFPGGPFGNLCNLEPIAVRQSSCSILYRPEALGPQTLVGGFTNFEGLWDSGVDEFGLDVKKGRATAINLACEPGRVGSSRKCTAAVRDVDSGPAVAPLGAVSFSGKATFSPQLCKLAPLAGVTGTSRCEVTYKASVQGSLKIRGEYQDEGSTHKPSNAEVSVQVMASF